MPTRAENRKDTKVTRKDYERIAQALREYRQETEKTGATMETRHKLDTVDSVVEILVDIFTEDNPRFTPNRFRQACR
jgi:hypothetical protein